MMLEARIASPGCSLYFATEVTPYDLENLGRHVHDLAVTAPEARLDVTVDDADWVGLKRSGWLQRLRPWGFRCGVRRRTDPAESEFAEEADHDDNG
jgi:hypothetical protein